MTPPNKETLSHNIEALVELGAAQSAPRLPPEGFTGPPALLVPPGYHVSAVAGWEPERPARIQEVCVFLDAESFCRYVNAFKDDHTTIFADHRSAAVIAVLDYHGAEDPRHGEHRASLSLEKSDDWKAWVVKDRQKMSQWDFATFLEENQAAVKYPDGADLLGIVNAFAVEGSFSYSKAQRLQNGAVKLAYTMDERAAVNEIEVPSQIELGMPVFRGGGASQGILARLRYRLESGNLRLWYELVRPAELERDAFALVLDWIQEQTQITPYIAKVS